MTAYISGYIAVATKPWLNLHRSWLLGGQGRLIYAAARRTPGNRFFRRVAMQRFFFDLMEDDVSVSDFNGVLMPELGEAELEAAGAIAQMMANHVPRANLHKMAVVIRDAGRTPVARVSLTLTRERMS